MVLVFGLVTITGAAAKEQGLFTECRLTTEDAVENAQYGRSVAIDGDLVAV